MCVEFGAWDGLYLSTTAQFWRNGWRGVLIEAAKDRYADLVRNTAGYDCLCINRYVRPDGDDALDPMLKRHGFEGEVDLLVIDVDGDDYHIFSGLKLRPRVICCEFNPTIPPHLSLVGKVGDSMGCSAKALVELAGEMGYGLVAMTPVNCIFVRNDELHAFREYETRIEALFPTGGLTFAITTYDGRYLLSRRPPYGTTVPHRGGFDTGSGYEILGWASRLYKLLGFPP